MKLPEERKRENDLHEPDYWMNTDHTNWSIMGYVIEAVKRNPGISKQYTYRCLALDLQHIENLYPESSCIQRRIKGLKKEFKKKSDIAALTLFWKDIKKNIEIGILEKQANLIRMEAASMKWITKGLNIAEEGTSSGNKRLHQQEASSSDSSSSKRHHVAPNDNDNDSLYAEIDNNLTTPNEDNSTCLEVDNIYIGDSRISVGTMIKSRALAIHEDYKKGIKLTNRERKIMVAGLSSILDLSDNSMESQRSLFGHKEWDTLNDYFMKQFSFRSYSLPEIIDDTWTIICSVSKNEQSIQCGLNYLYKLYGDLSLTKMNRNLLKIMEHCLDLLDEYQYLLKELKPASLITEQDYFRILWSRIFELLFPTSQNIRVKTGESVSFGSSKNKQELYAESEHVISFKVDARFVVDIDQKEYDVAALELAKDDDDAKIISDLGKLIREGKDNIDMLLNVVASDSDTTFYTYIIQLSGADCQLSTIHLASSGLYVVLPRYHFSLPNSIQQLPDFRHTMTALLTMKNQLNQTANYIIEQTQRRNSITGKLGCFGKAKSVEKLTWRRGTWYTPSRNDLSALPDDFCGNDSNSVDIRLRLFEDSDDDDQNDLGDTAAAVVEAYGYKKVENGWLNIYTNKVTCKHPLPEQD